MQKKEFTLEVAGRQLTAEFSDLADQANGSVLVRYGDTVVLVTAVMSKNKREGIDFFPLVVDYEEKFYAAGKILGSRFVRREGRPSDEAILSGRIVDRTIRPLFDQRLRNEVQVVITVLSVDETNDPDVPAVIGASLALATSNIPWGGPVSAVRIGLKGEAEQLTINPAYPDREEAYLDLLICGLDGSVNMIEAEAKEISEDKVTEALTLASSEIEKIQAWQNQIIKEIGKEKTEISLDTETPELIDLFKSEISPKLEQTVFSNVKGAAYELADEWKKLAKEKLPDINESVVVNYYETAVDELVHQEAIQNNRRQDGRAMDEIRPLFAQAGGLSPVVHGIGIFYRGGTHIMTVLTLGGPREAQLIEGMEIQTKKYFMHHYNFPPFSTGETGRLGGTNRRSIGHGALAEKSLRAVLPARDIFPYSIRLVSEALASNGSTSMGSVCGSSLALMDGGVPIKRPVAGIAMGLMMEVGKANYKILTDIQGPEDHYGDMDFKVAGTREGITGLQLDIKVGGIPLKILGEALGRAKTARGQILDKIESVLATPRSHLAPSAPAIVTFKIDPEKIGAVIGPGGKVIQGLSADTSTQIEIEDDGTVTITGKPEGVEEAKQAVDEIAHVYQPGERFEGEVVKIMEFGAFVKIAPQTDGLVHISELAPFRVNRVEDVVREGDIVPVVIKEIDDKNRISLSIKEADPDFAKNKGVTPAPERSYNNGDDRRPNNKSFRTNRR